MYLVVEVLCYTSVLGSGGLMLYWRVIWVYLLVEVSCYVGVLVNGGPVFTGVPVLGSGGVMLYQCTL